VGEAVRLCPIVQGVEFTVVEQNVNIRAIVLSDALEEFFGADPTPEGWLRSYRENQDAIDCVAADRWRSDHGPTIVVLRAERPLDFRKVLKRNFA
jgi:hypothetical protein